MIYSASREDGLGATYSQFFKLVFAILVMFVVSMININVWQKFSFVIYIAGLFLLIYATFYGYIGKGSRRWISFLGT